MEQQILDKIIKQVADELASNQSNKECLPAPEVAAIIAAPGLTEFVGMSVGDTIGLVIANVDPSLTGVMKLGKYKSIGIIGDRIGAGPQIMAVDEAVKATNTEIISVELPRDTKGGDTGASSTSARRTSPTRGARWRSRWEACRNISGTSTETRRGIWSSSTPPAPAIAWKRRSTRRSGARSG